MVYWFTFVALSILCRLLFSIKAYGTENVPRSGAVIIASNHASFVDPPVLAVTIPRSLMYLGRETLFRGRIWSAYLRLVHVIPIDRDGKKTTGLKAALKSIKRGKALVLFPEGARQDGMNFGKPQSGVGFFALRYNLPVVPVYIRGSGKAMPRGSNRIIRTPVKVFCGKPVKYSMQSDDKTAEYDRVARAVMSEIAKLKEEADRAH